MENLAIRSAMKSTGVRQWMVAERFGLAEGNFSRLLRRELPDEKRVEILAIIEQIHKEKK